MRAARSRCTNSCIISRNMSRGYGKYRRGAGSHASFHFDNLFKENTNKPSAAKSAATVGKWGITSFTSIRTINGTPGDKPGETAAAAAPPKPKKFFKSRNTDKPAEVTSPPTAYGKSKADDVYGGASVNAGSTPKRAKLSSSSSDSFGAAAAPAAEKRTTRKFFASKGGGGGSSPPEKKNSSNNSSGGGGKQSRAAAAAAAASAAAAAAAAASDAAAAAATATPVEKPPPIVLRICRGKSQLLNDSDESESTPTPASTPSTSTTTSPRALREAAQQQPRAENCRITRSARRSMQQDPSSSPATADTPAELSPLFTSPKQQQPQQDIDLSPQYIPAEKYEMERRAMYANLLKPNSPSPKMDEDDEEDGGGGGGGGGGDGGGDVEKSDDNNSVSQAGDDKEDDQESETDDIEAALNELHREGDLSISIPPQPEPQKLEEPKRTEAAIEEDWSTDSDSNSTAPESSAAASTASARDAVDAAKSRIEHEEDFDEAAMEDEMVGGSGAAAEPAAPTPAVVKLVISKKKGSIFKSRALVTTGDEGTKKRRALYRHKWSDDKDGQGSAAAQKQGNAAGGDGGGGGGDDAGANSSAYDEFGFNDDPLTRVTSGGGGGSSGHGEEAADSDGGVTSIKCTKGDKGYYTVVKNVKKAHQIQEIGEFQEFNDDVEYILDTLQTHNPISTRCLSAITLAGKCMAPAFRMHVRAHGTVAKFFKALHDATKDQSLGLCTATVMFVLSQDRLNMDLDRDCLELMLNLLESDVSYQQALDVCGLSQTQLEKNKKKVRELCAEIQSQGHAMHLNLDNITVGQLAMETLLSLTSKRAGEWFKEELRELGGLEHIMKTICECCRQVSDYVVSWTDVLLDKLRKVDRCLRVLENVTHNNEENQTYLLNYNNGIILDTLVNLYKLCDGEIPLYPVTDITDKESTGTIIREALLVTLKVLINLTHHFSKQSMGPSLIGGRVGIIETSLHLLLQVPHYIPEQKKFELGVLVLMLLINLIQDNDANKKLLMDAKAPSKLESIYSREESAVEALIAQFYHWEGCAKIAEKRTNAILDGEKDEKDEATPAAPVAHKSNEEFIEETVAKLLQKAGTHMEYTFLASYIAMLTGFLIMENQEFQTNVRQFLKGNNFVDMVELLKKFFNFMNLTASTEASSVCAIKTTEKVIKFLEECDAPGPPPEKQQPYPSECMDLSYTMAH